MKATVVVLWHFSTSAKKVLHFTALVPKRLDAKIPWVRSVPRVACWLGKFAVYTRWQCSEFFFFFFFCQYLSLLQIRGHSNYQIRPNLTKSDQIGVNRTKSETPSTKSGTFFALAFFLLLIYRELNFDTDCFNAYVTSCSYTN